LRIIDRNLMAKGALEKMMMKKSGAPYWARFLGAFAGLILAILVLEFAGFSPNRWIVAGIYAAGAWAGLMVAGFLASRK
jgi:hypothetical protein